jgi:type II secretory pathway predicted ATPase ExeA
MYEKFYGLREKPFALTPDPHFLYMGQHHKRALLQLEYGLANEAAFLLITGEVGSGKTTLIRYLLGLVDERNTVGLISNTARNADRLLQWVCSAYGLDVAGGDDVALYNGFVDFAIKEYAGGRRVVLIVDEAQNLGRNKLEELRVLSNVNVDKHLVLQTILVGQPELRDLMRSPQLRQFAQRIGADYHIGTLSEAETFNYVRHRLRVAGSPRLDVFRTAALQLVHASSRGVPRLVNQLCDTALVYGYAEQCERIDAALMQDVIKDRCAGGIFPGRDVRVSQASEEAP